MSKDTVERNAPSGANVDSIVEHLLELERLRRDSLVSKDFDTLATLLADEIVYTHSTGAVQDKQTYLAYARNALTFLSIERGELTVRVYGNVALMTGPMTNTVMAPSLKEPMQVRSNVLQLWVHEHGSWTMAAFQATRAPDGA
ncbi:nuclear transport factor 2 family protein [Paraburkholderia fungorum]